MEIYLRLRLYTVWCDANIFGKILSWKHWAVNMQTKNLMHVISNKEQCTTIWILCPPSLAAFSVSRSSFIERNTSATFVRNQKRSVRLNCLCWKHAKCRIIWKKASTTSTAEGQTLRIPNMSRFVLTFLFSFFFIHIHALKEDLNSAVAYFSKLASILQAQRKEILYFSIIRTRQLPLPIN